MKSIVSLFGFVLLVGFASCKKEDSTAPNSNTLSEQSVSNEAYGADALQKMDYYLPSSRTDTGTKVMIMIHGGAWSAGDKADFASYMADIKSYFPGWAIFNINYRLAVGTSNLFPTQENDVKAAVEYVYNHRAQYHISSKIVLMGASAGGHLALLQAYKHGTTPAIKAVVNFFGPSDITAMYNNPTSPLIPPAIAAVVGATPGSNPSIYTQSSPVQFVSASSPPTISLQGGADPLVSPTQQIALHALLQPNNVVNEYVFYPTEAHGWTGANLTDSYIRIKTFINNNVH